MTCLGTSLVVDLPVKILCFHRQVYGFSAWSGAKILHAVWPRSKKKITGTHSGCRKYYSLTLSTSPTTSCTVFLFIPSVPFVPSSDYIFHLLILLGCLNGGASTLFLGRRLFQTFITVFVK